jgi:hypothetical protein
VEASNGAQRKRPGVFSDTRPRVVVTLSGGYLAQVAPEQQPFWAQQPHWHWPPWQQPSLHVQHAPHLQPGPQWQDVWAAVQQGVLGAGVDGAASEAATMAA